MKVNKIFRVTLLAMLAALFAISMAYAESYTLDIDDDSELDFEIFTEYEDLEFYEGYNYYVKYHIPKLALKEDDTDEIVPPEEADGDEIFVNYELSWDFRPISEDYDFLTPTFTKDDSGDVLVLVGLLPESADSYGFTLTPKISGDYFESATINVSFDLSVEVVEFSDYVYNTKGDDIELWKEDTGRAAQKSKFRRVVSHDVSMDLNVVTHSYIVDVIAPDDEGYASYINSKDINLPYWLSFDITGTSNDNLDGDSGDYGVTSIRLKFNEGSIVADSTDAVVRIPLTEAENGKRELIVRVLGWPVTFSDVSEDLTPVEEWTPIELATTSLSFEFTSADREAKTLNAAFTNHAPVSYDVSCDFTATFATISVDLPSDTSLTSGNIPITVTPAVPSVSADHSAVITFVDSEDNKVSLDVAIKITTIDTPPTPPEPEVKRSFDIFYEDASVDTPIPVSITAGSGDYHVKLTTSGDVTGNIRWSVSNDIAGLTITPASQYILFNVPVEFTIRAASTLSADTYSVRINATLVEEESVEAATVGEVGKTAYADLVVTVSSAAEPATDEWKPIALTTSSITFSFESADADTKNINFTNHAPVSYDASYDSEAIESITATLPTDPSGTSGIIRLTVKPAEPLVSGDHKAVLTFVDSEDNEAKLDVTVKITVPEPPNVVDEKTLNITYGGTVVSSALPVSVVAGGSEEHLVLNTSGDVTGNIRWSVSNYVTGLAITPGSSTVGFNEDIDFTVKAAETLSADTYAVRITATLADSSKSAYVDVNVRVSAASNPGGNTDPIDNRTLNITNGGTVVSSALPVSVVAGGTEEHLVLNTSGDVTGNIRWSVTNNTTGLAITTSSSTVGFNEDIDFTFRAASTVSPGTYTVRITATLADSSKSAYVDVNVRVFAASNPGGNNDPIPGGNSSDDHNPNENLNPDSGDRNNIAPDDSDSNRGGFSNERVSYPNYYTGTAAEPENSNFNINDVELTSTLRQTLNLSANTDIAYLPGYAILQSRDSVDPKEIPYDEQVILVFPTYRVSEQKVYVFGVLVEKLYDAGLNPGDPMYIKMAQLLDTGSFNSSQATDSDYAAIIDSEGNVINKMPDLSADRVNIAAFFDAGVTYSLAITTASEDVLENADVGCSGGFGALSLTLLGAMFIIGKKWY